MTKKKTFDEIVKQYSAFGFDHSIIKLAWDKVKGDESRVLDEIIQLSDQNKSMTQQSKNISPMDQQQMLGKAIQQSIDLAKDKKISFQPLNPEQRLRKSGVPVGLKNIGNTCYFNSLLQTYFFNPNFVKQVLSFVEPEFVKKTTKQQIQNNSQLKRQIKSIQLVKNLQILFAGMIASDKKYLDPTSVITSIVDDYGNQIPIGDQKDIGQFNLFFLSRVEQGISLQQRYSYGKMQLQHSPSKIGIVGEVKDEESLMRRSSIRVKEQSTIGKQFFGKIQTTFINQKQGIKKNEQQMFTLLFLDAKYKQLYRAFEEIIITSIDDYKNQKGETVSVEKQCWIKQPPKTLFFQIGRVMFDKETLTLKKNNQLFDFQKTFFIDPFLQKNKKRSLEIRGKVNKLRREKQKFQQSLRKLQNYNQTPLSLPQILQQTLFFLQKQSSSMELQNACFTQDPTLFKNTIKTIKPQNLQYFRKVKTESEQRINYFKSNIKKLQEQIQYSYKDINCTPYALQSILIHEGQADSGHYYSYIYDQQHQTWRKYNDLNVSEQAQQRVLRDAKGNNLTSAYYLVYSKVEQKQSQKFQMKYRNYKLSNDPEYGTSIYSQYISSQTFSLVSMENLQLYSDIEHFKANSYVTKVIDTYTKRFESCNELFRKLKVSQKKKNSPPSLPNLPIFVKSVTNNDEQYKSSVMESAIYSFGPKQDVGVFEQVLRAKLTNLSDFKRPKNIHCKKNYIDDYGLNYRNSVIAKYIYQTVRQSNYTQTVAAIRMLRTNNANKSVSDYFNWLNNILSKLILLQLLIQAQKYIQQQKNFNKAIEILRILNGYYFQIVQIIQQNVINTNIVFWISQLAIQLPQQSKVEAQEIAGSISSKIKIPKYFQNLPQDSKILNQILSKIDINDQLWNFNRQQDTAILQMIKTQQQLSFKMKVSNDLLKQIKKVSLPLKKQQRDKIIHQK